MKKNKIHNTRTTGKEFKKEYEIIINKKNALESRILKRLFELIDIYPDTPYYENSDLKLSKINKEVFKALKFEKIINILIFIEEYNNKDVKQLDMFEN